ncbi:MAG: alginate O-acetyltransferase complex protein AlgI [Bradyrhizobium sp.]|jgi:alginate O-acetyltransferase complex protein AlgI|nr:alginate O-acetyltransferase complex protein AlgI [Bradyrhizobium sp.]
MSWIFLLQTLGPVVFGLIFMASGVLAAQPKWPGRLAFLLAQLLQIYAFGYGSIAGIGLVVCILCGFAVFAAAPSTSIAGRLIGCAMFFAAYLLYWAFEKYAVPLLFPPQASGEAAGNVQAAASLIAIVGISYIGFKFIHFFVDYRAGEIEHVEPLGFLSWLLFFPSIIAGPMQRFQDWNEQFGASGLTLDQAMWGLQRLLFGGLLKFVLADNIHALTLPQMSPGTLAMAPWSAMIFGALIYSLYLYFDFSGYCHIAIGTGVFWGIRLPENFNNPYIARNLAEFWKRWHITLSEILRDYLFYPLSLSVKRSRSVRPYPIVATIVPPIVTFFLAGLWHGAGIGYIIYGLIHGIGLAYLALRRSSRKPKSAWNRWWSQSLIGHAGGATLNYIYVSISFVFFSLTTEKLSILAGRIFH